MPKKPCEECKSEDCYRSSVFNKFLCGNCRDSDGYRLLTKTDSRERYHLTKEDLNKVTGYPGGMAYRRPITLVLDREVRKVFCEKHSIEPEQLDEHLLSLDLQRNERRRHRVAKANTACDDRRRELVKALAEYGLELRSDSKLCEKYINTARSGLVLGEVVRRMCEMHYLYNYTNMADCVARVRQSRESDYLCGEYYRDPYRESVTDEAERMVLKRLPGKCYPVEWPWMMTACGVVSQS